MFDIGIASFTGVGCTAKSTFVNRLAALTGGEDAGAAILGVSSAFTLGTGTLPLGILGVCNAGFFTANGLAGGAGVTAGLSGTLVTEGGVLGIVASEETCEIASSSSKVMTVTPCGIDFVGLRAGFASVFSHNGKASLGARLSFCTGLDNRTVANLVELCAVFCLFAALSTAKSFSFSFSCRA